MGGCPPAPAKGQRRLGNSLDAIKDLNAEGSNAARRVFGLRTGSQKPIK